MGELTESYIKLTRADTTYIEATLRRTFFRGYWNTEPRGLSELTRHMLISGDYVCSQFEQSSVEDWAACAVQYTRALGHELHRRLYAPCGTRLRLHNKQRSAMQPKRFMMGSLTTAYQERYTHPNWQTLVDYVASPSGIDEATLTQLVADIEMVRPMQNKVAHIDHVDTHLALELREMILGAHGKQGLLLRLVSVLDPG